MASGNLPSKLARALCYYAVSEGVVPLERAFWFGRRTVRELTDGPILSVKLGKGDPDPNCTGNYRFSVSIVIQGSSLKGDDDADDDEARMAFDAVVGLAHDAFTFTADTDGQTLDATLKAINDAALAATIPVDESADAEQFATNNADLADFCILSWEDAGYGETEAQVCDWEVPLLFTCIACETAIEGYFST